MGNITFDKIMDFYPAHNRSVYEDLKKDYLGGRLIPFVGAGLSVFCGYLGWPRVLKQLAGFVYDRTKRSEIEEMIEKSELLQAAQEICDYYPRILRELQKIIDYDKIRNCDTEKLHTSAVYILPCLFHESMVMTTNFDRVLEEVYDRHHKKFGKIISPYESDLLTQMRQGAHHCLFKLHGDIGPEIHDIERMVFTKTQYDRAYAANGLLMRELPHWFQNRRLLFLGCSLEKDRTMEVLQQVTEENSGLDHYAILDCKPENVSRRCREMGDLGISPIYYPDGEYDAVRVILERLLEETRHSAYVELKRSVRDSVPKAESRFMYNSNYIRFTGRVREIRRLDDFCENPGLISWWAVTGPGGMGKSRLIYEFTKIKRKEGWETYWLAQEDYSRLSDLPLPVDRCIVVADDVQSHLQNIGKWLASVLSCQRSEKLRILLLEREGRALYSARWAEMMQADFPYEDIIPSRCYCSDFLTAEPLSEDELKTIMIDFASASDKILTEAKAGQLMKTLQKIDGNLQRPIYALAVADAWCNEKNPVSWNKEKVLDELVKRELGFYYDRLRDLFPGRISKEMRSEFENIVAKSCVMPVLPLDNIKNTEYPKLYKRAYELDMDLSELLRQTGIVHKITVRVSEKRENRSGNVSAREIVIEAVLLDCPDLIKEYLVLKQAFDRNRTGLLLPDSWADNFMQMLFLHRAFADYAERFKGRVLFWEGFFAGEPETDSLKEAYGYLLIDSMIFFPELKEKVINRLESLHKYSPDHKSVALLYAECLVNQTAEQPLEDRIKSVEKLRDLYEKYKGDREFALAYAKGLVNQTAKQPLEDTAESVGKLRDLYEEYKGDREFALAYAQGLFNQTVGQPLEGTAESVGKLRDLYEEYKGDREFALEYAKGLFNQTVKRPLEDTAESVEKLGNVYKEYKDDREFALKYAKTLVNLSLAQKTEQDVQETLKESQMLLTQYPQDIEFQLSYAQTHFNLTLVQKKEDLLRTVEEVRGFLMEYPEANREFQIKLDEYLSEHPDHEPRYNLLRFRN